MSVGSNSTHTYTYISLLLSAIRRTCIYFFIGLTGTKILA